MSPKDQKIYNLIYDDVRGGVLRPPQGTTPAAVKKSSERRSFGSKAFYKIYMVLVVVHANLMDMQIFYIWRLFRKILNFATRHPWLIFVSVGNSVSKSKQCYTQIINIDIRYNFPHQELKGIHSFARAACDFD